VASPTTVISEHQLNPDLQTGPEKGGSFQDWIGPNGTFNAGSSIRYFTVSVDGENLGVVPVEYSNGSTYAYEGIWMYGDIKNPGNTQVLVNGSLADDNKTEVRVTLINVEKQCQPATAEFGR